MEKATRKLAAILSADMVGYSRLMESDEAGTIARQKAHRKELIDPAIAKRGGRIVKTTGDGILIEFASVVDAVECAVDVQRAMTGRDMDLPDDHRIKYRVGISLGDIVIDGDDILGDGVIVAARLERMAKPGEICISEDAHRQLTGKTDLEFEDLGSKKLKNIARPVRVYRLDPHAGAEERHRLAVSVAPTVRGWHIAAAALLVVVLVAAGAAWWRPWVARVEAARLDKLAFPLPDKPSIAVLPFDNLSGDTSQDPLADGLSEDLITALSKVPNLFVISRRSTFAYKGKAVKVRTIAEEFGVRYVIEGSVRRSGDQIRVNVQLIDALDGRHVWAERYDRAAKNVFAMQDEIILSVLTEVRVKLMEGERARLLNRGTRNLDAWLLSVRATAAGWGFTKESTIRARRLYEAALKADPNWSGPLAGLAWTHWIDARYGFAHSRKESVEKGVALAERAIKMNPRDPLGYMMLGNLREVQGRHREMLALREKAADLAPYDFNAISGLACRLSYVDQAKRAIALLERARRLSPRYAWWAYWCLGFALHLDGKHEQAIEAYNAAIKKRPRFTPLRLALAAIYADLGQAERARKEVAVVLKRSPSLTASKVMKRHAFQNPDRAKWFRGLLVKAGLSE